MSTHSHDWLPLVEVSGLTVSEPVLLDAFPGGPPPLDGYIEGAFRREVSRWQGAADPDAARGRWVDFVIEDLLGHGHQAFHRYPAINERLIINLDEYQQKLYPHRVLVDGDGQARLLVVIAPAGQDIDKKETESGRWRASPFTKIDRLLRETGVPLGLLTNGEAWRLVYAEAGLPTATIEWTAQSWLDERGTLRAFLMLLGEGRFDADRPADGTIRDDSLIALIRQSQERQIEVADQLGAQVRAAIRVFVRTLDEADREAGGELLAAVTPAGIYEMAIIFMMRLVFLLYAEERKLLPHGEVLYDQAYGLTYLFNRLQRQHRENPDTMSRTYDAWLQLLAAFAEVSFVDTSASDFIPAALKLPFMVGKIGIIYGKK